MLLAQQTFGNFPGDALPDLQYSVFTSFQGLFAFSVVFRNTCSVGEVDH